ncbi:NAD-dependent epimerase/dehydratase family protein [Candidatus Hydrogenedentota bacterium]
MTPSLFWRMVADIVLLLTALMLSFAIRWLLLEDPSIRALRANDYLSLYAVWGPVYVALSLAIFSLFGLHTRVRGYRIAYKLRIVCYAVSMSNMLLQLLTFMFDPKDLFPRGVVIMCWGLSLVLIGGPRLFKDAFLSMFEIKYKPRREFARKERSVLVVGGCGYIGSILCRRLLDAGYKVRVLDALLFGTGSVADLLERDDFELQEGDFRHLENVVRAIQDVDSVVHLGGLVGDPACGLDAEMTISMNSLATRVLVDVAKGHGVERFVFASSCSVYGAGDNVLIENSNLNPLSLYARTKIESEEAIVEQCKNHPMVATNLRFATVFGWSHRPRFDLVVNLFSAQAARDKLIRVFNGNQWRPFIHVRDICEAIYKVLEADPSIVNNQTFNVGGDSLNLRISDLGRKIREVFPDVQVDEVETDGDLRNYRVSFKKIFNDLKFECAHTIEDGITEIAREMEQHNIVDYKDPLYSNIRHTEKILNETDLFDGADNQLLEWLNR